MQTLLSRGVFTHKNINIFIAFMVAIVYLFLWDVKWENADTTLFGAYYWNYFQRGGLVEDLYTGLGGNTLDHFGVGAGFLFHTLFEWTTWDKRVGYGLCVVLMLFSLRVWYKILGKLGISDVQTRWSFCLLLLLSVPVFKSSHTFRPDAFCFLFGTISLFLFLERKFFLSALGFFMALESHSASAFFFAAYLLGCFLVDWRSYKWKDFVFLVLGVLVGVGYYVLLHYPYLSGLFEKLQSAKGMGRNVLENYFFRVSGGVMAQLYELLLFSVALILFFINKMYRKLPMILPVVCCVIAATFIIPRSSYLYILYVYPIFLLIFSSFSSRQKYIKLGFLMFSIVLFAQYAVGYYMLKSYKFPSIDAYLSDVSEVIDRPLEDSATLTLVSHQDWFAFKDQARWVGRSSIESCIRNALRNRDTAFYLVLRHDQVPRSSSGIYMEDYSKITHYLEELSGRSVEGTSLKEGRYVNSFYLRLVGR